MIGAILKSLFGGDMFMWAILGCGAIGLFLAFERFMVILMASKVDKEVLLFNLKTKIMNKDINSAVQLLKQKKSPLTEIIYSGINSVMNSSNIEEVQTAMDAAALKEVPKLEKRISLINTCANICTLLGLLGTVAGLIAAFDSVANVAPDKKAEMLANAIAVAMNTTAFGLIFAIPLLGIYGYLSSRSEEIISDIHESSVATLNFILSKKDLIK